MHEIEPARLKPGVTREAIASAASAVEKTTSTAVIRGRALILWDLKVLGKKKKLDAIDTDQITPAADCVSESLDTLDEGTLGTRPSMSHVTARQEVETLLRQLKLPIDERGMRRAAARQEWFAAQAQPLELPDLLAPETASG